MEFNCVYEQTPTGGTVCLYQGRFLIVEADVADPTAATVVLLGRGFRVHGWQETVNGYRASVVTQVDK